MKSINIVIPDGSMQEKVTNLLTKAGLEVIIERKRTKEGRIAVPWISKVALQRPQEIPQGLKYGAFDVGIVGEDWIANWGFDFPVLLKLPIGRSGEKALKVVLAVSKKSNFKNAYDLPKNCMVATEYIKLAKNFFLKKGREDIQVIYSYGNTEQKIQFGASAIVDVTESGESLIANDLIAIEEIMESNTVLVACQWSFDDTEKRPYIDCLSALLKGAYQASKYVLITANVPGKVVEVASKIIGGLKGASMSPLVTKGWTALQSVVPREKEQDIIFNLLQIGVTDIVVNRDIPLIMT